MRKIYLIILGPSVDKDFLIQRIRDLGDVYIVYGNKKQREYYSLYKELYYVMNDTYRGQTGGILAYIDENDIRNALIQNGWKQ